MFFIIAYCVASTLAFAHKHSNLPVTGFTYGATGTNFDKKFVTFLKKWHVPGASLAVMRRGHLIVNRGYGWSNKAKRQPVYPSALFRIASVSKTITAVTVLRFVQSGKLRLNDKVFHLLSDLKPLHGARVNKSIYGITVKNLLQMSSGWFQGASGHFDPLFGPWPLLMQRALSPELPASCQTTVRFMMSQPLRYRPGTHYAYSNLDYCLLGLLVDKISKKHYGYRGYEEWVRKTMLIPANITDMRIGSTQIKHRFPKEVTYYADPRVSQKELDNSFYFPYSSREILRKDFANAGWIASARDLAVFIQALKYGHILSRHMIRVMQSKPDFVSKSRPVYYTMGGLIYHRHKKRYWVQTGSFTGSNALIVSKPNGTTIAVIFNYRPEPYAFFHHFRPELIHIMTDSPF